MGETGKDNGKCSIIGIIQWITENKMEGTGLFGPFRGNGDENGNYYILWTIHGLHRV